MYRIYVLILLMVVYAFNFIDRQIIAVLAPFIKAEWGISDAQLGLLFGTAFALFYGLMGIPLARLADGWSRVKTLSLGLAFWSLMTTLSGFAANFGQLAFARVAVGIGEATASPSAISLLGDYFRKERRSTILAIYSVGVYLGIGASLILGGAIVAWWQSAYSEPAAAPFGLAGWQAAFIGVGLPGVLLALLVLLTVREPVRGALEGRPTPGAPHPVRDALREAASMFPPWSFASVTRHGSPGDLRRNILLAVFIIVLAVLITVATDFVLAPERRPVLTTFAGIPITSNVVQWTTLAIAGYAALTWLGSLRSRDPVAHALIAGSSTFMTLTVMTGLASMGMYAVGAFGFLYGSRYLGLTASDGLTLGAVTVVAGGVGVVVGGVVGDWAKRRHGAGRILVVAVTYSLFGLATIVQFTTASVTLFYASYAVATFFLTSWPGCLSATGQDLVLPRMRGTAFATQGLGTNIIGLGLGPYLVGLISDGTGSLRMGILAILLSVPLMWGCAFVLIRRLGAAEATVVVRAREAGEPDR